MSNIMMVRYFLIAIVFLLIGMVASPKESASSNIESCQQALIVDDKILDANGRAVDAQSTHEAAATIRQLTPERADKYSKCFSK